MVNLSRLNPEQRDAVVHTEGPLLILAGAGSGKTRVIVHRIAYLLNKGVDPEHILAVSFTNRAVREMEERVADMVKQTQSVRLLTLSTFHSLGVRILRRDIGRLDYPNKFVIYDTGDQIALVKRSMQNARISDEQFDPKTLLEQISAAKNRLEGPEQQSDAVLREVYSGYQRAMRSCGAVDFDDLIFLPTRLLQEEEVLNYWSGRYRYIMIDEYQDTNPAQLTLVRLLATIHGNLCVVGDDDQSIYGWRGSDVQNIRQFPQQFANTRVIMLTQNYRCSANILEAANKVIAEGADRFPKQLWTESGEGPLIDLAVLEHEEQEAISIANKVMQIRYEQNLSWSDIAVLYRTNAQSRLFEEKLRSERIPYRLVGGQKFFERKEVRDAISYLRVLHRPDDEMALRRIINYPPRGIGDHAIECLTEFMKKQNCSLYAACLQCQQQEELGPTQKKSIQSFTTLLESHRERLHTHQPRFSPAFQSLLQEIRLTQHLYKEYDNLSEAKRRVENVDALVNSMVEYEERFGTNGSLEDYLDRICLDQNDEDDEEKAQNTVTLITLHGAKGLEFPVVFLAGVEEGFMPYFRGNDWNLDLEEERRLCYVGITRAKQRLFLSYARQRRRFGQLEERSPSRFLDAIPSRLLRISGAHFSVTDSTPEEKEVKFQNFFSNINSILGGNE